MIWLALVSWHINHCRFLIQNPLYKYILNVYDLVDFGFSCISTIVGYFMPNPIYTYVSNK